MKWSLMKSNFYHNIVQNLKIFKQLIMRKFYLLGLLFSFFANAQTATFDYAKTFGSTNNDSTNGSVIDASGNIYTIINFRGTIDADPGSGVVSVMNVNSNYDILITKLDASGNYVWSKKIGGTDNDVANDIAIDLNGNIFIAGYFAYVVDFNPDAGTNNMGFSGGYTPQGFLLKLDSNGTFGWSKQFSVGATTGHQAVSTTVAVDSSNNVILGGYFAGVMAIDSEPVVYTSSGGSIDCFYLKYSNAGTFQWSKQIGSLSSESITNTATDSSNNIYFSGNFNGNVDFDPSAVSQNLGATGAYDSFLLKIDGNGNTIWVNKPHGASNEYGRNVAVNSNNEVFLIGNFQGTTNFASNSIYSGQAQPAAINIASNGGTDNFIMKFNSTNGNSVWVKTFGGTGDEYISSATFDASNNIFSTGYFNNTVDFDPNGGVANVVSTSMDAFVSKLNSNGDYVWATRFGGNGNEVATGIIVTTSGKIITSGYFGGNCYFNPNYTDNVFSIGGDDAFVQVMSDAVLSNSSFNSNNLKFDMYPNPAQDYLIIESNSEIKQVQFYSISGQLVLTSKLQEIPISSLITGIYFVKIENVNGEIATQKLVKN